MTEIIIGYSIILIFFIMDFIVRKDKVATSISKTKDDNNTTKIIIVIFFIILIVAELLTYSHTGQFEGKTTARIALVIMLAGVVIRMYSMTRLKKLYTRTLLTTDQQQLVKTGLYRIIRHPGYLGTILIWSFFGLAIQNYIVFIFAFPLILIAYTNRIKKEEKMLLTQFGQEYLNYKRISWKLVPFIW